MKQPFIASFANKVKITKNPDNPNGKGSYITFTVEDSDPDE